MKGHPPLPSGSIGEINNDWADLASPAVQLVIPLISYNRTWVPIHRKIVQESVAHASLATPELLGPISKIELQSYRVTFYK